MKISLRRHLFWKIFLSYMLIILAAMLTLAIVSPLSTESSMHHHMINMSRMPGMVENTKDQNMPQLLADFKNAARESTRLSIIVTLLAGVLTSAVISYQMVAPVKRMTQAAERIAGGHYDERVKLPQNCAEEDMDELNRLLLKFNQMAESLEHVETMRRQLIGDVAHELRTPLTTIKGSMEGLMDGVLPPGAETYQHIIKETSRLERLVSDLQELSRVESGAFTLVRRPLDTANLVRAVAARLERQFEEKGVSLQTDLPGSKLQVLADEDRIHQVLTNLAGNALQYTPGGGKVLVSVRHSEEGVLFSVQDNGAGIAAEHLPHLFDRFYRVDKSRARPGGGSGIGLTIARHLVEAHGGHIRAESAGEGKGSTFSFSLPHAAA